MLTILRLLTIQAAFLGTCYLNVNPFQIIWFGPETRDLIFVPEKVVAQIQVTDN